MSWESKAGGRFIFFVTSVPLPQVNSTPSATEIHYKKILFMFRKKERAPKNPHKDLKCSSKPTRRVSASAPATPPARALKKIINTIKCSLKSVIKRSHLEAVQWGNKANNHSLQISKKPPQKQQQNTRHCMHTSRIQKDQLCPFHGAPKSKARGAGTVLRITSTHTTCG